MKRKVFFVLGAVLILSALVGGPGAAAQIREPRRSGTTDQGYMNPGYNNGYSAGYSLGQRDGEAKQSYDPTRHPAYNRTREGYDPRLGSESEYQDSYRVGFEDGYQDGYYRLEKRATSEGPTSLRYRAAFARGYQEGYNHGREDVRNRTHYNYSHDRRYQSADLGYNSREFPSLEDYQFNFRKGYEAGYDDGYNNRPYSDQRDPQRTYGYRGRDDVRGTGQANGRESDRSPASGSLLIPEGSTMRLELNNTLSTRSSQIGDPFSARVIDPVRVGDRVAVPAGSIVQGVVARVVRPGRAEGKAELHLQFDKLVSNGRSYNVDASIANLNTPRGDSNKGVGDEGTIKGPSSTKRDVGQIAIGTGVGAVIGAIVGGGKGAAIGAGVGAGAGVASVLMARGHDVDLPQGTNMTIKLNRPLDLRH